MNCFVIMPVTTPDPTLYADGTAHFSHVLDHLFRPALEAAGYDEVIPPSATGADLIHAEIISNLESADLVLCDMSTHNPNVFYELGIRTALDKPVALVRDDKTERIPFDTSIVNAHTYDSSLGRWLSDEIPAMTAHISACAERSVGRNAMWRYFGITSRGTFQPGETGSEEKVDLLLQQVRRLADQIYEVRREMPVATDVAAVLRRRAAEPNPQPEPQPVPTADEVMQLVRSSALIAGYEPSQVVTQPPHWLTLTGAPEEIGVSRENLMALLRSALPHGRDLGVIIHGNNGKRETFLLHPWR